nr:MAG TPA: hypothetical protein [Caudoviricetes sp.]
MTTPISKLRDYFADKPAGSYAACQLFESGHPLRLALNEDGGYGLDEIVYSTVGRTFQPLKRGSFEDCIRFIQSDICC